MVAEEICLCDAELEVEDVEILALDATNVAFAKDACTERPVDVL